MTTQRAFRLLLGIIVTAGVICYFQRNLGIPFDRSETGPPLSLQSDSKSSLEEAKISFSGRQLKPLDQPSQAPSNVGKSARSSQHELTAENIEEDVRFCYQGESCELKEDPWQLYLKLKTSGRAKATDALISYMRKELKNPKYRDQYKDVLLKMIDDFYPSNNLNIPTNSRDFQHAAYYYYLGDIQASLDIYLKMEKAASNDPNAFDPFKLNIANDYYELHQWKEALVYYRKALDEALSERLRGPDQQAAIHFIQDRINELERK